MGKTLLGFMMLLLGWHVGTAQFAVQSYDVPEDFSQHDMATDALENVVVCGAFPMSFGGLAIAYKYTSSGALAWSVSAASINTLKATEVAIDQSGNVFLAGNTSGNGQLTGGPVWTTPGTFLVKYSPSGTLLWAQHFSAIVLTGMSCTSNGDVILAGI